MKIIAALAFMCAAFECGAQQRPVSLTRKIEFYNPQWSPDGKKILFESTLDGRSAVFVINHDGTGLNRLTAADFDSYQPNWSADGGRIVFSSDRDGRGAIYIMRADGSDQKPVTTGTGGYQSSFSPDGSQIVFQGRPSNAETRERVYIVNVDGSGFRQLTDTSYSAEGPRWSRDGRTITFNRVPYPKRLWSEMSEADMQGAKAAARQMSIRVDGSGLAPAPSVAAATVPGGVPDDAEQSRDRTKFAYNKAVDGWAALYVYDVATKKERLIVGGAGAGPIGYLRTATLVAYSDTLDSFTSARTGGALDRGSGAYVIESLRRVGAKRWEKVSSWRDSTGKVTATQSSRTMDGSLATELETVRADVDSASMLVNGNRVTGWVVPAGNSAQLFDGANQGERYASAIVIAAIARSKPAIGRVFMTPSHSLYGGSPLEIRTDSIRVIARDTLVQGAKRIPAVVLQRGAGSLFWIDEDTGAEVASRGNAGPDRYWWHIRRGVSLPRAR